MSWALVLALTLAVEDPRIELVRLQLDGRPAEAIERSRELLAAQPETAHRSGVDYLLGMLHTQIGEPTEAGKAFNRALDATPELAPYSRFRLAETQDRLDHPEVAAGLVADLLEDPSTPRPLVPRAVALLRHALAEGGDCRLLGGIDASRFPTPERRQLTLSRALCDLAASDDEPDHRALVERGRRTLFALLEEDISDETAREAVERILALRELSNPAETMLLIGKALHEHRDFQRSVPYLEMALMTDRQGSARLSTNQKLDARYELARGRFWLGQYAQAAHLFGELADATRVPERRARALYQRGRSLELADRWGEASASFQLAYNADSNGRWADAALLSALRLEWRTGNEGGGLELYRLLASKRQWRPLAGRAALFLAASDLVQQRSDRAAAWLDLVAASGSSDASEVAYWRGRMHELEGDAEAAVASYLEALRSNSTHPLARSARRRLASPALAHRTLEIGRRLAATERAEDLYAAWLLLGDTPAGEGVRRKLLQLLIRDRDAAPYLQLSAVPVESWPLWRSPQRHPEDLLLALGAWSDGAPAVRRHFPIGDLDLAFTSSALLARSGEHTHSLRIAQVMAQSVPSRLPPEMLPVPFRQLLYPAAYDDLLVAQTRRFGVEPALLRAVIREESHFNPDAISGASARGLTQFVMPTARKLGFRVGLGRVEADDLYRPAVAITLGAAYLGALLNEFDGLAPAVVAAYNAGEPQARLWRDHCFSSEPEEYYSKVGFKETRGYVRKVLTSYHRYRQLYPPPPG